MDFIVQPTINKVINISFNRYSANVGDMTEGQWNNLDYALYSAAVPNVMIADLVDDSNTLTGIGITNNQITGGEAYGVEGFLKNGEAQDSAFTVIDAGTVPGVIYPRGMGRRHNTVTTGQPIEFLFTGLDATKLYNFKIIATSAQWSTGYTYDCIANAVGLNTIFSNVLTGEQVMGALHGPFMGIYGVDPDGSNQITLQIAKGPNAGAAWWVYCNALIIEEITP